MQNSQYVDYICMSLQRMRHFNYIGVLLKRILCTATCRLVQKRQGLNLLCEKYAT
jgi:hypothetical protein